MFSRRKKEIPKKSYYILSYINKFSFRALKETIIGFFKTSKINFETTISKIQNLKITNIELGKSHFFSWRLSDSLLRFKIANKFWPGEREILRFLGIIYWLKNEEKLAKSYWQKFLDLFPDDQEVKNLLSLVVDKDRIKFIPIYLLRYRKSFFHTDILMDLNSKEKKMLENKMAEKLDSILADLFEESEILLLSSEIINDNNLINKENKNYLIDSFAYSDILEDHNENNFSRPGEKLKVFIRDKTEKYNLILCFFAINFEKNLSLLEVMAENLAESGKILFFLPIMNEKEEMVQRGYFRYEEYILNNIADKYSMKINKLELVKTFYENIWIFLLEKTTHVNI